MATYEELWADTLDRKFDADFKKIRTLTWLPWIGKRFDRTRVLVITKLHPTRAQESADALDNKKKMVGDGMLTREMIAEYPLQGYDAGWIFKAGHRNSATFDNVSNVLCGSSLLSDADAKKRTTLWSSVAFMELVQKPMWYKGKEREKPVPNDFMEGWETAIKVVQIIKPKLSIVFGLETADHFNVFVKAQSEIRFGLAERDGKIGKSYPRSARIELEGDWLPIRFVPSMYFPCREWREFAFSGLDEIKACFVDLK